MFYNWCLENKLIKKIDFKYKKLEEIEKPIYALNLNQVDIFLQYIDKRCLKQRLIFILLLATGIRRNELINIKKSNIDFLNNCIFLSFTKTHNTRYCYFSKEIKDLIIEYMNNTKFNKTPYLFCSTNGFNKIKGTYITQMFFYAKECLNFDISANILRHTYATYLLKNGATIEELRQLLGHKSYQITKRYLLANNKELQEANKKYNLLYQANL